jgi:predicted permease
VEASEDKQDWEALKPAAYDRLRSMTELFSQVAGSQMSIFTVMRVPAPDQIFGLSVSGNYFTMVGAHPWRGRILLPEDDRPGAPAAVLLSFKVWQQLFAGDPKVVGKTAEIDGQQHTVIGIMPSDFVGPGSNAALWTALRLTPAELAATNARSIQVVARLRPAVTVARAQVALAGLQKSFPGVRFRVSNWQAETDSTYRLILFLAMAMVCGLLIIACANLASILMARAVSRRRDYAIRLATGASRSQLISQALLEVCLLAFAALLISCPGTAAALHLIRDYLSSAGSGIPNIARIQLNAYSLLFSFSTAFLAALVCGVVPAFSATSIDLASGLRDTATQTTGARPVRRFLYSLVAVEAGVSMVLLLTSGLLVRSLVRLMTDDHGLKPDHVLTLRLPTGSWQRLSTKKTIEYQQRRINRYLEMLHQAQATRGVQAAALSSSLPLSHTSVSTRINAPNPAATADAPQIFPITQAVTGDYFRVMGIPILSGRTFEDRDAASKLPLALVNQAFVRKYFKAQDPAGKFLYESDSKASTQIIGVVQDSPHLDFAETIEPEIYLDFDQTLLMPFLTGMVVRTQGEPQSVGKMLAAALSLKNSDQAVVHVRTLRSLIDENVWQPRFSAWLFSVFASIALCLAGIGIYGVVAYVTTSRRRDFGIRTALGASPLRLFGLAARQSLSPVLLGAGLGALGSYWTSRWISALLYKTSSLDAGAIMGSAAILLLLAFAATAGPALRAARVDPAITLRSE